MSEILELALLPFQLPFMQSAFVVTLMIAIPMALLSCLLVLKGWSLMGDAVSHAVLPGVVIAYIAGIPLAIGAFVAGLRYGEGVLYTKNAGDLKVYWQGPSIGFDAGGEGSRTMMLVYNLPATGAVYQRFAGIDGSAYFVGGFGMTALTANNIVVVPIRSGVGLRLGANIGYLKFTPTATWNPF